MEIYYFLSFYRIALLTCSLIVVALLGRNYSRGKTICVILYTFLKKWSNVVKNQNNLCLKIKLHLFFTCSILDDFWFNSPDGA